MPVSRDEYLGYEFDWFAIDCEGQLALCSSAGHGEIPQFVLQQCSDDDTPSYYIDRLIEVLPETGGHLPERGGAGDCLEWPALGNRGIYVFDWQFWSGPYNRIIVPKAPIHASTVPSTTLALLKPVTITRLAFRECSSFQGAELGVPVLP